MKFPNYSVSNSSGLIISSWQQSFPPDRRVGTLLLFHTETPKRNFSAAEPRNKNKPYSLYMAKLQKKKSVTALKIKG